MASVMLVFSIYEEFRQNFKSGKKEAFCEPAANTESAKEPEIDNSAGVEKIFHMDKTLPARRMYRDIDARLADDGIIRGRQAQTSRVGTVRSTVDSFARFYVDQANVDEAADWININTTLDNDPKFQPLYQK